MTDIRTIIHSLPPMAEGEQVNVHHCKEGRGNDRLYVKRTNAGWIYNCFHCGQSGGIRETATSSVKVRAGGGSTVGRVSLSVTSLPSDCTGEWGDMHPRARVWLGKYLTAKEVTDHGILYSPRVHRVILPVWRDGSLVGYQARQLDEEDGGPKYLTYSAQPSDLWYYVHSLGTSSIVLVEDFLSAAKCSYHMDSAALFGTALKDSLLARLVGRYSKCLIFLDDDNAQVKMSARKIKKRLDIFMECVIIEGVGYDPKALSHPDLEGLLV